MTLFAYPNTSLLTFSTHILTRRMTICDATNPTSAMIFNSHPHKEDDTLSIQTYSLYQFFNSHPHKEDDHHIPTCTATITFSTHILTRRMTVLCIFFCLQHLFFNSHPHKEDDHFLSIRYYNYGFSTHILTRRMTFLTHHQLQHSCFSTHILTRRMTVLCIFFCLQHLFFNSHPHKEDDKFIWC